MYACHKWIFSLFVRVSQFMAAYDDSELGAPDEGGVSGVGGQCEASGGGVGIEEYDQLLLQYAVDDFDKNFKQQLQRYESIS